MYESNLQNIIDKKILIVGMGKSGVAATQALLSLGANVTIQDSKAEENIEPQLLSYLVSKEIKCYLGNRPANMDAFDMVVLSPGVDPDLDFINEARVKGVEVIGELEIAFRIGQGKYAAITGTNGKTTTTTLVGEIFRKAGVNSSVAGNIGIALISESVKSSADQWLITETSSFQLETIKYFNPEISAILNLTPDHLNRHKTMKNYGDVKARIFENQDESEYLVINYDDKECFELAKDCKAKIVPFSRLEELNFGAFVKDKLIIMKDADGIEHVICKVSDLKILGDHNVENALAASAISFLAGINPEVIGKAIEEFKGVKHRIEYVRVVDGINYYNDSKGTNVDATLIALDALKKNIILIAGGDGKSQNFDVLGAALKGRVKALVLLGKDAELIEKSARKAGFNEIYTEEDMYACIVKATALAQEGDNVLLSPACASWDMYDNFEQRGEHFKDCVELLES
ncbi:MAG: UDP-N-acetylmuramoyl-L-alanine--D-glutamate ligase [Peptostreptococcaceae bacterium]|nr:UDP-N-acetylmuramoyl-L-alanine--D-glutamate ligase [Peptostreptococcaceae bacterium]